MTGWTGIQSHQQMLIFNRMRFIQQTLREPMLKLMVWIQQTDLGYSEHFC